MSSITPSEIANVLIEEGASCVIQYGSSLEAPESAHDVDLCAVYPDESPTNMQLGRFDILRLSREKLAYYRRMRNPVYCTEPCLTGEVISGDAQIVDTIVDQLNTNQPSQAAINHNVNRSMEAFTDCVEALQSNRPDYTIGRLHFVATYWLFATWYQAGNQTEPLAVVQEKSNNIDIIDDIFTLVEQKRSEEEEVDTTAVTAAIEDWQSFLLTSRFECPTKNS